MLETVPFVLRTTRREDFPAFASLFPEARGTKATTEVESMQCAWRKFLAISGAWTMQGYSLYSVFEECTGQWIGMAGPSYTKAGNTIVWCLSRPWKHFSIEAVDAVLAWSVRCLAWPQVSVIVDSDDPALDDWLMVRGGERR